MRSVHKLMAGAATVALLSGCGSNTETLQNDHNKIKAMSASERFEHDFLDVRGTETHLGQSCLANSIFELKQARSSNGKVVAPATAEITDLGEGKFDVKSVTGTVLKLVIVDHESVLDVREDDSVTRQTLKGYDCLPGTPYGDLGDHPGQHEGR